MTEKTYLRRAQVKIKNYTGCGHYQQDKYLTIYFSNFTIMNGKPQVKKVVFTDKEWKKSGKDIMKKTLDYYNKTHKMPISEIMKEEKEESD